MQVSMKLNKEGKFMKKKGFTLSEILIALAIVGSITAISIPMIHRIMPDKDKAIVLKVFKMVNEINDELINNPTLYRFEEDPQNLCNERNGILNCTTIPLDGNHSTAGGDAKYPRLLAEHLSLLNDFQISGTRYSFRTSDGVDWVLDVEDRGNIIQWYDLTIDTNNPQRTCVGIYGNDCRDPRQFRFQISNSAVITANDPLTQAYLENPDDLSNRAGDLQRAAEILAGH